jgi:hypothetical protein
MINKTIVMATLLVAATAAQATIILDEGFDDITSLAGSGWTQVNNSAPAGETGWFQGNLFDAQAGAADSFIAANFLNAGTGGDISNWLLSPTVTLFNGATLTFYTRTTSDASFADRLELRLSQSGASSDVGGTSASFGDFGALALTINPALGTDYPTDWTQYSVTFSGITDGTLGRFAFRYAVPDTATNGNFIGIDSVTLSVPEPSSFTLMLVALLPLGFAVARRRKPGSSANSTRARTKLMGWTIGMALAATCSAEAADTSTQTGSPQTATTQTGLMSFPNVRVVNAPIAAAKPTVDKSAAGMRVYIDPKTKQIREQTPEEALQEAKTATKAPTQSSARSAQSAAADAGGTVLYGPGNAVGMTLGENAMVFEVAHKQAQGAATHECVTGKAAAEKALNETSISTSHTAEVRDER